VQLTTPTRLLALVLMAALWVGAAYSLGAAKASEALRQASTRQIQIIALDLEAMLERYETLPYALSFQAEALGALQHPQDQALVDRLNTTLLDISQQARVSAIYLMNANGVTIATSNRHTVQDYTGKNFGFRPYFLDALHGRAGRFYAIGSTTNEPGYFIAQPVFADTKKTRALGVMAVKISLDDIAKTWKKIDDPVVLTDRWGVIFLSNRDLWQYHSLAPLTKAAQGEIERSQQYMGHGIAALSELSAAPRPDLSDPVMQTVGRLGWRLQIYPATEPSVRAGLGWAMVAFMMYAVAAMAAWAIYQRKKRLEEQGLARQALQQAAHELERRIDQRTHDLMVANDAIEGKYRKLQETEYLLRSTQNQLVQAGKLTMLGQMAAGVTHELSQPLMALRAFADNAKIFLARGQSGQAEENLTHIIAASERMAAIIGQLKGFARKSDQAVVSVDMAQSLRASVLLLQADFERAGATLSLQTDTLHVTGDATRIEQVLINLLRNALDAVRHRPQKTVCVCIERDDTECRVQISDSGPGISAEVQAHLFEPFFSTKSAGGGLGLGLAISSSIVQALNGRLSACNLDSGGAQFTMWLPLAPPQHRTESSA
jgi:two-component system C4-dicarboxylate transport sensor histidine kinase DctB